MFFSTAQVLSAVAGFSSLAAAHSAGHRHQHKTAKRDFSCDTLASGLTKESCEDMVSIGMAGQGTNSESSSDDIFIGEDGPNTFTFTNSHDSALTLILWQFADYDYQASFMNARTPAISYTLDVNATVTISLANDVSGGWAGLYIGDTTLSAYGQISNTWGEFTTGSWATVDVSREVNMKGKSMSVVAAETGCVSDMETCVFQCNDDDTCGDSGTYSLVNCESGSQDGASYGTYDGTNPEGGCMGFSDGGHLDIEFGS